MIEGITPIGAVTASTPSGGGGVDRRRKRLKWLSSLRAAQDGSGPLSDDSEEAAEIRRSRAEIADALSLAEQLRGLPVAGTDEDADRPSAPRVTATDLARRIAASAALALAAQAHAAPAAVRRYIDDGDENLG